MKDINPASSHKNQDFIMHHSINVNWAMPKYNFHDSFEIFYCLSDDVTFFVGDAIYSMNRGSLIVFNNMDLHKCIAAPGIYERYILYFVPQYIHDLALMGTNLLACFEKHDPDFCPVRHLSPEQSEQILGLFEKAFYYCNNAVYGQEVYKKITLAEILLFVNSLYISSPSDTPQCNKDFKRVLPIIQFIQNHLHEEITLDRLSETFFMDKYYMGVIFKKATGFTIIEYIIGRRITRARELLQKQVSVQQTGEATGFNDTSHFIRTFKKIVGLPPKQYAKQYE